MPRPLVRRWRWPKPSDFTGTDQSMSAGGKTSLAPPSMSDGTSTQAGQAARSNPGTLASSWRSGETPQTTSCWDGSGRMRPRGQSGWLPRGWTIRRSGWFPSHLFPRTSVTLPDSSGIWPARQSLVSGNCKAVASNQADTDRRAVTSPRPNTNSAFGLAIISVRDEPVVTCVDDGCVIAPPGSGDLVECVALLPL